MQQSFAGRQHDTTQVLSQAKTFFHVRPATSTNSLCRLLETARIFRDAYRRHHDTCDSTESHKRIVADLREYYESGCLPYYLMYEWYALAACG